MTITNFADAGAFACVPQSEEKMLFFAPFGTIISVKITKRKDFPPRRLVFRGGEIGAESVRRVLLRMLCY